MADVTLRPALPSDGPALGRFGAALARQHHDFDRARFMLPEQLEEGYRSWLLREAAQDDAVVLVAERAGELIGYAYGRLEARDWNALLDAHGGFHDLWVDESARGSGVGRLLAETVHEALTKLGAPRVVLKAAARNEHAQKLFRNLGWRPTMVEMTREA